MSFLLNHMFDFVRPGLVICYVRWTTTYFGLPYPSSRALDNYNLPLFWGWVGQYNGCVMRHNGKTPLVENGPLVPVGNGL
jgi:hypothetical protein